MGAGVDTAGQVSFVRVSVDIRHSYIGDLVVSLSAPRGMRWCCMIVPAAAATIWP